MAEAETRMYSVCKNFACVLRACCQPKTGRILYETIIHALLLDRGNYYYHITSTRDRRCPRERVVVDGYVVYPCLDRLGEGDEGRQRAPLGQICATESCETQTIHCLAGKSGQKTVGV